MGVEKNKIDSLNKIISEYNTLISDINNENIEEKIANNILENINEQKPMPCGRSIRAEAEDIDVNDIIFIEEIINDIKQDIKKSNNNLKSVLVSDEKGNQYIGTPKIKIKPIPKWVKEIKNVFKNSYSKGKTKVGIDYEALSQGKIKKSKNKGIKKQKEVIFCIDISGSMFFTGYKGLNLYEEMLSFLPNLVKKYNGETWFVDVLEVNENINKNRIVNNKKLTKGLIEKSVKNIIGGGSTTMWGVFSNFYKISKEANFKSTLIMFTDLMFDLHQYPKLIHNNGDIIIVTRNIGINEDYINEFKDKYENKKNKLIILKD